MEPTKFFCVFCGQSLETDDDMGGAEITCPACGKKLSVPNPVKRFAVRPKLHLKRDADPPFGAALTPPPSEPTVATQSFTSRSSGQRMFKYEAKDSDGDRRWGTVEAENPSDALQKVRSLGLFPSNIAEATSRTDQFDEPTDPVADVQPIKFTNSTGTAAAILGFAIFISWIVCGAAASNRPNWFAYISFPLVMTIAAGATALRVWKFDMPIWRGITVGYGSALVAVIIEYALLSASSPINSASLLQGSISAATPRPSTQASSVVKRQDILAGTPDETPVEMSRLPDASSEKLLQAEALYYGIGGVVDEKQAKILFRKAASEDQPPAKFWLARLIYGGRCGFQRDAAEAQRIASENFKALAALAEKGDRDAEFLLGDAYASGLGVNTNLALAVQWLRSSAKSGNSPAILNLGLMCSQGLGVPQDEVLAVKLYRQIAEQEVAAAEYSLGACYANGQGVAKDLAEAAKWYRKAADLGYSDAQFDLGLCYQNGEGVANDLAEAAKWYRKAADLENACAEFALGACYANGKGVDKDLAEATQWNRKSAGQGYAAAQTFLGLYYQTGQGVPKDLQEANKWLRKSADQGEALAQFYLGCNLHDGQGVSKDLPEAAKWLRKSADQGNSDAQLSLGSCYETGQGVPKDLEEAAKWYRKSADQGNPDAQLRLGKCFFNGWGVAKDYSEATKLFRKSAEKGNAEALASMGLCYAKGWGVPLDTDKAEQYWKLAVGKGEVSSRDNLALLRNERNASNAQDDATQSSARNSHATGALTQQDERLIRWAVAFNKQYGTLNRARSLQEKKAAVERLKALDSAIPANEAYLTGGTDRSGKGYVFLIAARSVFMDYFQYVNFSTYVYEMSFEEARPVLPALFSLVGMDDVSPTPQTLSQAHRKSYDLFQKAAKSYVEAFKDLDAAYQGEISSRSQ